MQFDRDTVQIEIEHYSQRTPKPARAVVYTARARASRKETGVEQSNGEGYYRSDLDPATTPHHEPLEALSSLTMLVFGLVMPILGLVVGGLISTLLI